MLSQVNLQVNSISIYDYEKALFSAYKASHKVKYHFCKNGNVKLGGSVWTYSKTYSDKAFFVDAFGGYVTGSCIGYCDGCRNACYVAKSYRYGSVILNHAINTCGIRYDLDKVYNDLRNQLLRARKKPVQVRIDQSGELMSHEEFLMWCELAKEFSDIAFYVYTKAYDIVIPTLLSGSVPGNLTVLISVWHEFGIREFFTVAHLNNVKAFVYDDHTFDYSACGLIKQTECKAYGEDGKLDHNITCEKCKKCFNRLACHKVIFCNAH